MLFSVEQAFVGREEIRSPLKTPAGEASRCPVNLTMVKTLMLNSLRNLYLFLESLNPYSK